MSAPVWRAQIPHIYKGKLILEDFDWQFGMTPSFDDYEFCLPPDRLSKNQEIAGSPLYLYPQREAASLFSAPGCL